MARPLIEELFFAASLCYSPETISLFYLDGFEDASILAGQDGLLGINWAMPRNLNKNNLFSMMDGVCWDTGINTILIAEVEWRGRGGFWLLTLSCRNVMQNRALINKLEIIIGVHI